MVYSWPLVIQIPFTRRQGPILDIRFVLFLWHCRPPRLLDDIWAVSEIPLSVMYCGPTVVKPWGASAYVTSSLNRLGGILSAKLLYSTLYSFDLKWNVPLGGCWCYACGLVVRQRWHRADIEYIAIASKQRTNKLPQWRISQSPRLNPVQSFARNFLGPRKVQHVN